MFTGIVQGTASVASVFESASGDNFRSFKIAFPEGALDGVSIGASIAINGTCLTVTGFDLKAQQACFDVIDETLQKTNLSQLQEGSAVNYERAAKFGDEIGGHVMSGHVLEVVRIADVHKSELNTRLTFEINPALRPYILTKGYVGLNGCSLTIGDVSDEHFSVHLIPETLQATTFGNSAKGDIVNLEIDAQTQAIVDTVERIMASRESGKRD